ncbi:hypothetical protein L6R49_22900 [Myxococcota bacterium]|nr:hypothetical protein [Myxococcota bacterium]
MEHHGRYTLAVQQGDFGYYAEVAIVVTVESGSPGLVVDVAEPVDAAWDAGARFGVAYAFERAPTYGVQNKAVRVTIKRIRGHVVDTTAVVVAYASARAFWDALQLAPPRDITLDSATGTVSFPK